MDKIAELG